MPFRGYVRELYARGLRGLALTDAVELELKKRGIPAGPRHRASAGYDVLHRDFLPPGLRSEIRESRSRASPRQFRSGYRLAPGFFALP